MSSCALHQVVLLLLLLLVVRANDSLDHVTAPNYTRSCRALSPDLI